MARTITISYPRLHPSQAYVRVDLEDVRAANTLIIHFDFDRDGFVIESPTKMMWLEGEDTLDERLEEVAFIPAFSELAADEVDRVNGRIPRSEVG